MDFWVDLEPPAAPKEAGEGAAGEGFCPSQTMDGSGSRSDTSGPSSQGSQEGRCRPETPRLQIEMSIRWVHTPHTAGT